MRWPAFTIALYLACSSLAQAQHDPYGALARASQEFDEASELQRRLQQSLLARASETNANIASLRQRRQDLADQTTIGNNVISLRNKDELARWVEEAKQRWGAESGPRIRIFNPYEESSYARYYDEKGNLMVTEVRNSYEWLKQSREDWEKARKRSEQLVEMLETEYAQAVKQYGNVEAGQSKLAAELETARRRLNDFTGGKPNSVEEGLAGGSPSPAPQPAPQPKPRVLDLAGRTGSGEWVVNGRTTYFTYEFQPGGRVVYRSNRETLTGTWTQSGNSVTMQVGKSYEVGTITGNKLVLRCDTGTVGQGIATVTFRD